MFISISEVNKITQLSEFHQYHHESLFTCFFQCDFVWLNNVFCKKTALINRFPIWVLEEKLQAFRGQVKNVSHALKSYVQRALKGEFHGSTHARILTGLCTLSGTGPGFSLFMNQS